MANEIVVETKDGGRYLGHDGGEETVDGNSHLLLENPREIEVGPAEAIDGADQIKIPKEKIERVRDLEEI
ncbi:MAG: hypothetical protein SVV03_00340 [Candidatus Nanohaloarchaea archaeon]|nr:hypothetical protein [Candidatus Nanohaloarchaea archaeon]